MMLFHDFRKRFKINHPLVLDGAIGTELLLNRGSDNQYLWALELNFTFPETVKSLHRKYLQSGAQILSTNTFRTNFLSYKNSRLDIPYSSFVNNSVALAKYFKDEFNFLLAGCNAPAEDCYQKERTLSKELLHVNHLRHIEALYNSGVDFI
ncbi:MAG TPA: homocysteine S-methyltransferase family protein, partial [Ignavibacteriaceae bacterium]|nr:homocysteine S-methyltransferase family protein [Ignavibacteriaceae bacterium]